MEDQEILIRDNRPLHKKLKNNQKNRIKLIKNKQQNIQDYIINIRRRRIKYKIIKNYNNKKKIYK